MCLVSFRCSKNKKLKEQNMVEERLVSSQDLYQFIIFKDILILILCTLGLIVRIDEKLRVKNAIEFRLCKNLFGGGEEEQCVSYTEFI